jgi:hypothetical protein
VPPVDRRRGSVLFVTGEPWITEFVLMIEKLGYRTVRLSTPRSLPAALSMGLAGGITGVPVPWPQMTKEVGHTLRQYRKICPALSVIVAGPAPFSPSGGEVMASDASAFLPLPSDIEELRRALASGTHPLNGNGR